MCGGSWLYGSRSPLHAPFCATIAQRTGMPALTTTTRSRPSPTSQDPRGGRHGAQVARNTRPHAPGRDGAGRVDLPRRAADLHRRRLVGWGHCHLGAAGAGGGEPARAGGAKFSGVLYSPWLNLACDTLSYVSQIFKLEEAATAPEHKQLGCSIPGSTRRARSRRASRSRAMSRSRATRTLAKAYADGRTYAGSAAMIRDPIASPMMATEATLANMPPLQIHVGLSEVLVSESVIFATKMAAAGASSALHMYDQMWHVFSMYYEGCEHPKLSRLLFAESSLNLTSFFFTTSSKTAATSVRGSRTASLSRLRTTSIRAASTLR